jgi:hypothetical protein
LQNISPWCKAPRKNKTVMQNSDQHKARGLTPAKIVLNIIYFALGQPRIIKRKHRHQNARGLDNEKQQI